MDSSMILGLVFRDWPAVSVMLGLGFGVNFILGNRACILTC